MLSAGQASGHRKANVSGCSLQTKSARTAVGPGDHKQQGQLDLGAGLSACKEAETPPDVMPAVDRGGEPLGRWLLRNAISHWGCNCAEGI